MLDRLAPNSLLAKLDTQPRVRDFLARAVTSGRAVKPRTASNSRVWSSKSALPRVSARLPPMSQIA